MTGTGPTALNLETADQQYLLSAALITSALLSLIQITRFKIWRTGKRIQYPIRYITDMCQKRLLFGYWFT